MKYPHRIIASADIHIGHHITSGIDIIERWMKHVITVDKFMGVDIFYIPGDLIDRGLQYGSTIIPYLNILYAHIGHVCRQTNTKVRLLEGTPSHDARQGINFASYMKINFPDVDFRYITDMEIEYIGDFDIHVMYLPDEWASREVMYLTAKKLLKEHNLEQVDFLIGHNQFKYQFNETLRSKIDALNEEDWNDLISKNAFFGHIHRHSIYKKIVFTSSFDRLAHGEEDPKGYIEAIYYDEETSKVIHHHNPDAEVYMSINLPAEFEDISETTIQSILAELEKIKRERFNIRFVYLHEEQKSHVAELIKQLNQIYPACRFTSLYKQQNQLEDKKSIALPEDNNYIYIDINRENIVRLVEEQLEESGDNSTILRLLEDYVNEV